MLTIVQTLVLLVLYEIPIKFAVLLIFDIIRIFAAEVVYGYLPWCKKNRLIRHLLFLTAIK